jgi:hypothetical protein
LSSSSLLTPPMQSGSDYPCYAGILLDDAINVLKQFYSGYFFFFVFCFVGLSFSLPFLILVLFSQNQFQSPTRKAQET